jgi:N-acetylneuraminic acid mutarotase
MRNLPFRLVALLALPVSLGCAGDIVGPSAPSRSDIAGPLLSPGASASAWTIQPRLRSPHAHGVAITAIENGKARIYLFGGYAFDPVQLMPVGVQRFDVFLPHVGRWGKKGQMPFGVFATNGGELIDGKVYLPGGINDNEQLATMLIYDLASESWQTVPGPRIGAYGASGVIDGQLYVLTGWSDTVRDTAYLDRYDPVTGQWTSLPNAPHGHLAAGGAVIGGKFYVVGGISDGNFTGNGDLDVYDPVSNSWSSLAPMPNPKLLMAVTVLNGKLYLFGGRESGISGQPVAEVDIYDPLTDTWSTGVPMLAAREAVAVARTSLGNGPGAYLMGGANFDFEPTVGGNHLFDPAGTP